jgi:hypothetical protein
MSSLFKRFKKKLPVSGSKNVAYYKRENIIGNLQDMKRILSSAAEPENPNTEKEITINNIPLMEISVQKLKNKFGNPSHVLKNDNVEGHTVLFYKDSVSYYRFLIQYHFINNKFFFAGNKISSMAVLSDSDKQKITNRISEKYLGKAFSMSKGWKVLVVDPNHSTIRTLDDVYFYLYYLAGNDTTRELAAKYADLKPQESERSAFKDSLDQYI